jgi:hypothetical protein
MLLMNLLAPVLALAVSTPPPPAEQPLSALPYTAGLDPSFITDEHSPNVYRVNGLVVNMPEFAHAFQCKAGQPMVKPEDQVCRVW